MDPEKSVEEVKQVLEQVWQETETHLPDVLTKQMVFDLLAQVGELLDIIKDGAVKTNADLVARTEQGKLAAAALIRQREEMANWKHSRDGRVRTLVDEVMEKTRDDIQETTEFTIRMHLEQKLTMMFYEAIEHPGTYLDRQQLAANVAGWLANFDWVGEAVTAEQSSALRYLAESLNGVWLDEVEE